MSAARKELPHNLDAEASVLGAVFLRADALADAGSLTLDDFYDPRHRRVFSAMRALAARNAPIDPVTVADELTRDGVIAAVGGVSFLSDLVSAVPTADNIAHYVAMVREDSLRREVFRAASELGAAAATQKTVGIDAFDGRDLVAEAIGKLERVRERFAKALPAHETRIARPSHEFLGDDEPEEDLAKDWLIPGFVPRGSLTFLAGVPKAGKTWYAIDMAMAVSTGAPLFGHFPVFPGRVLALLEEDPERQIQQRIWRLARGRGIDPRTLDVSWSAMFGFLLDDPAHLSRLEKQIVEEQPKLLVVDALARVHGADENDRTAMQPITRTLTRLARQYDLSVVMLHHFRKPGAADGTSVRPGDLMRGTGDLFAVARSVIGVTRADANGPSTVQTDGNYGAIEPFSVELVQGEISINGWKKKTVSLRYLGDASDAKQQAAEDKILGAIRRDELTATELRNEVGGRATEVDAVVRRLEQAGRIVRKQIMRQDSRGRKQPTEVFIDAASRVQNEGEPK